MKYKISKNYAAQEVGVNKFQDDGIILGIPFDPANRDYQEYLEWVDEGNTAEEAD